MKKTATYTIHHGTAPLVVSIPHCGTVIPEEFHQALVPQALQSEDSDWHLDSVYAFARDLGASLIFAHYSRYVIDLNRPADNQLMYAQANNTELVPSHFFSGAPLYRDQQVPSPAAIEQRKNQYWLPYHQALSSELQRVQKQHGHVVLWDGHSIRSRIPWLFSGKLPDLNLGTADGESCAVDLQNRIKALLNQQNSYTTVINGRFKGGHITRHYGRPADNTHAVQMEICQCIYMEEAPPFALDPQKLPRLVSLLRQLLETCVNWKPPRGEGKP